MTTITGQRVAHVAIALGLAVGAARLGAQGTDLYNNTNTGGVSNRPAGKSAFSLNATAQIAQIVTYHWNNGRGATPGTISLQANANGRIFGPYRARGTAGQGNAQNVNWIADVNVTLPAGSYVVLDSDPNTWSQNAGSAYRGFVIVRGRYLGAGRFPFPPSNPYPPTVTPPPPALPPPCHRTTGAQVELASPPCFGPVGTTLRLVVMQQLPTPLAGVVFKPGPIGMNLGLRVPPSNMAVTVQAGGRGTNGLVLVSGTGTSVGSVYQVQAPASLCMPGRGVQWTWDIWLMWPGGRLQGDIDAFTVTGC